MRNKLTCTFLLICLALTTTSVSAAMEDDPILYMLKADKFEARDTDDGTVTAWEGYLWVGKDLNKLWIKSEGEHDSGDTESAVTTKSTDSESTDSAPIETSDSEDTSERPRRRRRRSSTSGDS